MKKKLIVLFALVALSLTACGSSKTKAPSTANTNVTVPSPTNATTSGTSSSNY